MRKIKRKKVRIGNKFEGIARVGKKCDWDSNPKMVKKSRQNFE